MIVLAFILYLPTVGPSAIAYPDHAECMKSAAKYVGATCESRKIYVMPSTFAPASSVVKP